MKVIFTARAEDDLERIGDAVAKDAPRRAASFVEELRQACTGLASMPQAFPIVARFRKTATRRRTYGNYLIFYRLRRDAIVIRRILHGAMNYEDHLSRR